jgi:hypothetical protein
MIQEIRRRTGRAARSVLTSNSVGWVIYLVPIAIAAAMYRKTVDAVRALMTMTEPQLAQWDIAATVRRKF